MLKTTARPAEIAQRRQGHVFFYRHPENQTIALTVFGDIDNAVRQTILRRTGHHFAAIERHGTAAARQRAVQHFHQFGPPGAHQPGNAEDLPLAQGKGHVIHPRAAEVVDLQAHRAGRLIEVGILVFQLTADHHLDKSVLIQRRDLALGDKLPVTKDRHVVANLEDLFHTVGDIDDTAPLRLQFADDAEQRFGFGIGQRIGRFIHNDDFRFEAQHFGDFHHLLIANR